MRTLIENFSKQLTEALAIGNKAELKSTDKTISNVLITGLGGSGIGGSIVSELIQENCPVPVSVNKTYHIPAFVNEQTLVIVSSYSGNTEETLFAMDLALQKGAEVAIITSGGRASEIADEKGLNKIVVPGGNPPRSMLAYSFVQQFFLLEHYGLINDTFQDDLISAVELLDAEEEAIVNDSLVLAENLEGQIPIIYSIDGNEGVAIRWRQQLNENSKMLCWHQVVPEMNHNELVGWKSGNEQMSVIFLRNDDDFDRNQKRVEINQGIIREYTPYIYEVWSKGASKIEKALYLIHFGDWVSLHLSDINKVDVMEIEAINHLKSELAKF